MRTSFFLVLLGSLLPATIAGGCGSVVVTPPGAGGNHGGIDVGGSGSGEPADAAPDFVDPGCPDAGAKVTMFACDPFKQGACPSGTGCYIFSQPPQTICGPEVFGSFCASAGPGGQGDGCNGDHDCGGGFTCVVTGSGNQCSQLCPLQGASGCPAGMVCEPIDVQGFGGCF